MVRSLVCEICGTEFKCGAPFGCWCSGVITDRRSRDKLSMVAKDCVCRACLEKATQSN